MGEWGGGRGAIKMVLPQNLLLERRVEGGVFKALPSRNGGVPRTQARETPWGISARTWLSLVRLLRSRARLRFTRQQ